jgi:hypothetical protein
LTYSGGALVERNAESEGGQSVRLPPSRIELCLLWLLAAVLFAVVLIQFQSYASKVYTFGDNDSYLAAANAIRHWNFRGIEVKVFWGLSYVMAGLSWLRVPLLPALLLICMFSSLISVLLARHLWARGLPGFSQC